MEASILNWQSALVWAGSNYRTPQAYLESEVAKNMRPLCPQVAHDSFIENSPYYNLKQSIFGTKWPTHVGHWLFR